ncbi:response regulator transcription factor [Paraflavitalea speifideaquila]|uniref:LytR/AlgR family response regulator transcription factor n=1 Tax=Paraflavitalea speifideaquila TaxID=3076558 RepID=UPI0028EFEB60|nr:response regulator transcription factor [Paraflavitalea speifideiaquila]
MINSLIVDDELRNVSILRKMIERYCSGIAVTGEATTIAEAKELIRTSAPQLVFLDIEMRRGNAFDLLDQLEPVNFEIIFVTAFDNYAIKAFKYNALDYLLKPIDVEDLKMAIEKASKRIEEHTINQRLDHFMDTIRGTATVAKIALPVNDGLLFYAVKDIVYCTAEGGYTWFGFVTGKRLLVSGTLKEFEDMLPPDIFAAYTIRTWSMWTM